MPFEDKLLGTIRRAKQEREQEENDRREFGKRWDELKSSLVRPAFEIAAALLEKESVGGSTSPDNGGVILEAGWEGNRSGSGQFLHKLSLRPDYEARRVIHESSLGDAPEPLDLSDENLLRDVLEIALDRFVYAVVRGKRAKGRSAGASSLGV